MVQSFMQAHLLRRMKSGNVNGEARNTSILSKTSDTFRPEFVKYDAILKMQGQIRYALGT